MIVHLVDGTYNCSALPGLRRFNRARIGRRVIGVLRTVLQMIEQGISIGV
jgi:hypothetical protein